MLPIVFNQRPSSSRTHLPPHLPAPSAAQLCASKEQQGRTSEDQMRAVSLQAQLVERAGEMEGLHAQLAERTGEVEGLQAQLAERTGEVEGLQAQLAEVHSEQLTLKSVQAADTQEHRQALEQLQATIRSLEAQLKDSCTARDSVAAEAARLHTQQQATTLAVQQQLECSSMQCEGLQSRCEGLQVRCEGLEAQLLAEQSSVHELRQQQSLTDSDTSELLGLRQAEERWKEQQVLMSEAVDNYSLQLDALLRETGGWEGGRVCVCVCVCAGGGGTTHCSWML